MNMYICLEGIKGSGKSTAFEYIKRELDSKGIQYAVLCPTKPITGFNIRELLNYHVPFLKRFGWWNSWVYSLRSNKSALIALQKKRTLILGDRSILTSYVTRRIEHNTWEKAFKQVNRVENIIPLPDIVVYFKIDPAQAHTRLRNRKNHFGVTKHETLESLQKAANFYEELRDKEAFPQFKHMKWVEINGAHEPRQICDLLLNSINNFLNKN